MTASPDTETRVIVDLMLALNKLLDCCYQASQAGGQTISIAMVRTIAASAMQRAQESVQPTPAERIAALEAALQQFTKHNSEEPTVTITVPSAAVTRARSLLSEGGTS